MTIFFLFDLFTPRQWTDAQAANVISLVGAVTTVGALAYAFFLERKNSKKINDLAEITKELSVQNKLLSEQGDITKIQLKEAALPVLVMDETERKGDSIWIYFKNEGKRLKVTTMRDEIGDFIFYSSGNDVLPGDRYIIYASPKDGKILEECKFRIFIEYKDIYGNPYNVIVTGSGENWTSFTNPKFD